MKVVILAGGYGSRISEESSLKPKPMIEIGGQPILWHIMKEYYQYGFNEFIICCGYKQQVIKEYFNNYFLYTSDVTFDFKKNTMDIHSSHSEDWKVTLVDTGLDTLTAGRLKRVQKYIGDEQFMLTYGDGVGDINIDELIKNHKKSKKIVTLTSYNFGQRFGVLDVDKKGIVTDFREKKSSDASLINAGYMVMNPEVFKYLPGDCDNVMMEEVLEKLASDRQLNSYNHKGFWYGMDTQRDKQQLEEMWKSGKAKWKTWDN